MLDTPAGEALSRYLSLSTQQMKLTATNMANVDTPGYKTVGIDFEGEFAKAIADRNPAGDAAVGEVSGLIARPDGNNVSTDRESMTLAASQLQFRTGVELLRHEYTRLADAIKSDMR